MGGGGFIIGGKNFFGPNFVFLCLWRQHPFLHKTKGPTRNPISPTPPPPSFGGHPCHPPPPPPPPPQSNFQVALAGSSTHTVRVRAAQSMSRSCHATGLCWGYAEAQGYVEGAVGPRGDRSVARQLVVLDLIALHLHHPSLVTWHQDNTPRDGCLRAGWPTCIAMDRESRPYGRGGPAWPWGRPASDGYCACDSHGEANRSLLPAATRRHSSQRDGVASWCIVGTTVTGAAAGGTLVRQPRGG